MEVPQEVFVMPRKYSHIQEHEKEILELREQGMTLREIGEKLGFSYKATKEYITRYNRRQRKLAAGIIPKPKGRPRKAAPDQSSIEYYKAEIERLKMENELLRDFLQSTERE